MLSPEEILIVAANIFQNLGPLLTDEYLILACFYPFLESLIQENTPDILPYAISLMQVCLEVIPILQVPGILKVAQSHELEACFGFLFPYIGLKCSITNPCSGPVTSSLAPLTLAVLLLRIPDIMHMFVKHPVYF